MISTAEAKYFLAQWVSAELTELRRDCYYPDAAPMFKDYQAGYRSSSANLSQRDEMLHRVGVALNLCRPANKAVLLKAFMQGDRVGRTLLGIALDEFRRVYSAGFEDAENG